MASAVYAAPMAMAWVADTETLRQLNAGPAADGDICLSDQALAALVPNGAHLAVLTYSFEDFRTRGELDRDAHVLTSWAIEVEGGWAIVHIKLPLGRVMALQSFEATENMAELAERLREAAKAFIGEQVERGLFIEQAEGEIDRLTRGDIGDS
jgi:hypothetical protein